MFQKFTVFFGVRNIVDEVLLCVVSNNDDDDDKQDIQERSNFEL